MKKKNTQKRKEIETMVPCICCNGKGWEVVNKKDVSCSACAGKGEVKK